MAVAIALVDYYTLPNLMIFFLLPVILTARRTGLAGATIVSTVSGIAWASDDILHGNIGSTVLISSWNIFGRLVVLISFGVVLAKMLSARDEVTRMKQYLVDHMNALSPNSVDYVLSIDEQAKALTTSRAALEPGDMSRSRGLSLVGKMPVVIDRVSPYTLIEDAIERVTPVGGKRSVSIHNHCTTQCSEIMADEELTERILTILIGSAIKTCPPGSSVHIQTEVQDNRVEFCVEDDGPGMDRSSLHKAMASASFSMPITNRDSDERTFGFCRAAIESQGGFMSVVSELGIGTSVIFTLPTTSARFSGVKV